MADLKHPHLQSHVLDAYLDAALGSEEQNLVENHLQGCPVCRERLSEMRSLFDALESLPDLPLTHDLAPSIVRTINRSAVQRSVAGLVLLFQGLLTIVLLAPTWRVAGRLSDRLLSSPASRWNLALVESVIESLVNAWNEAQGFMQQFLLFLLGWTRELTLPLQSGNLLWPLLVSALMIWLIANGLLLGVWQSTRRNGGNH